MHHFRFDSLASTNQNSLVELSNTEKTHLFKILRANPGDEVGLMDGRGNLATAVVEPGRVLRILDLKSFSPPKRRLHLFLAPPRKQKMDQILKQVTELGVWRIVPFVSARSVAIPKEESISSRWNDLLFEACKQSVNPFLPEISAPSSFSNALVEAKQRCDSIYFGSPREEGVSVSESHDCAFFVGPEGGFTEDEEALLKNSGAIPLRVGSWTLRVETAAVSGVAVLSACR